MAPITIVSSLIETAVPNWAASGGAGMMVDSCHIGDPGSLPSKTYAPSAPGAPTTAVLPLTATDSPRWSSASPSDATSFADFAAGANESAVTAKSSNRTEMASSTIVVQIQTKIAHVVGVRPLMQDRVVELPRNRRTLSRHSQTASVCGFRCSVPVPRRNHPHVDLIASA